MTKSGIYSIRNVVTDNLYVGSSYNLHKRKLSHFRMLRKGNHHSTHLQRSFLKHGTDNFIFSILEECSIDLLLIREQFYIDTLKPRYNICKIAGNSLGTKRTEETKRKLSVSHKGQKAWNKGIPRTKAEKEKQRLKILGVPSKKKGTKLSDEVRERMSKGMQGKVLSEQHRINLGKKVYSYTMSKEYIETFDTLSLAAKSVNSRPQNLGRAIKNNKKFKNKYFTYEQY